MSNSSHNDADLKDKLVGRLTLGVGKLINLLLMPVWGFVSHMYLAYVVIQVWNWFILPIYHVPCLSLFPLTAVLLILRFCTVPLPTREDTPQEKTLKFTKVVKLLGFSFVVTQLWLCSYVAMKLTTYLNS